jgi:glucose/arabinose dehydrogenase
MSRTNMRGMLGIAVTNNYNLTIEENRHSNKYKNSTYVFLYFTKGQIRDGEDNDKSESNQQFHNSLYRYQLVSNNTMLINPRVIFELPPTNHTFHNGGALLSGPDGNIYVTIGPAAIKFFNSDKLGQEYKNNLFVGDVNNGYLYHFDLVENRTALKFDSNRGPLYDKIADDASEMRQVKFGKGFGGITDIEVGPYDGYLYIVSHKLGTVFRIVPIEDTDNRKS